jgi:hypothetical protein
MDITPARASFGAAISGLATVSRSADMNGFGIREICPKK